jgi:long-chain fatty acid transport protein
MALCESSFAARHSLHARFSWLVTLLALIAGTLATSLANAGSGFELRSQSVTTLGSAQAGMIASAADVSTIAFNPAALAYGRGTESAIGVTGLFTNLKSSDAAAITVLGTPIPGNDGGNAGTSVAIPNLYLATGVSDDVRIGVAVASRFGLGSYWSSGWVGRYYATDGQLQTIDVVPMLSYRASPTLSLGLGIDVEYAKIKTKSAIDFGTIDQVVTGGVFGGIPGGSDGSTSSKADSFGVGFSVGLIYEPRPGTRFGVDYQSRLRQKLSGNATFDLDGPAGQGIALVSGAFQNTSVNATLDMPQMVAAGFYHEISPDWAMMADVKWTEWSVLQTLQVNFGNPAQPPARTVYSWRDSWFATIGARYRINDQAALRFGAAYDQTPVRDETRNPILPDSDGYWAALGLEYRISPGTKLDFAYGHIFTKHAPINLQASGLDNTFRGTLSGTVTDSHVDYVGIQLAYRF